MSFFSSRQVVSAAVANHYPKKSRCDGAQLRTTTGSSGHVADPHCLTGDTSTMRGDNETVQWLLSDDAVIKSFLACIKKGKENLTDRTKMVYLC